jgi:hypothetical protein
LEIDVTSCPISFLLPLCGIQMLCPYFSYSINVKLKIVIELKVFFFINLLINKKSVD